MQSMHKPSGEPAVPMPVMVAADLQDALLVAMRDLQRLEGLRSEEHTSELQSPCNLVCRLLLEKKKTESHFVAHGRSALIVSLTEGRTPPFLLRSLLQSSLQTRLKLLLQAPAPCTSRLQGPRAC